MNGHRITGLPIIPLTPGKPIAKGFVERYYSDYTNIMTFKGKPGNVTILRKGGIKLSNGVYTDEMDIVLTGSRGYDIMIWGDCGGSGYNVSTKYKHWSWSYENKIAHA